jgi:hypothetical protein
MCRERPGKFLRVVAIGNSILSEISCQLFMYEEEAGPAVIKIDIFSAKEKRMSNAKLGLDVDGHMLRNEPAVYIVSTTDADATVHDLVSMTDAQARKMADALEAAKQRRRIADYDVWLVIAGVREHSDYAAGLYDWLVHRVPGERKGGKQ